MHLQAPQCGCCGVAASCHPRDAVLDRCGQVWTAACHPLLCLGHVCVLQQVDPAFFTIQLIVIGLHPPLQQVRRL